MYIVLIIGQERGEHGVSTKWVVAGDSRWCLNVRDGCVLNLLDGVCGKSFIRTVPNTSTLQAEFGVIDFVIDRLFESVITPVHPSDVSVALHVHADRWVERVSVVDGHTGVVDNNQVAFGTKSSVFDIVV